MDLNKKELRLGSKFSISNKYVAGCICKCTAPKRCQVASGLWFYMGHFILYSAKILETVSI